MCWLLLCRNPPTSHPSYKIFRGRRKQKYIFACQEKPIEIVCDISVPGGLESCTLQSIDDIQLPAVLPVCNSTWLPWLTCLFILRDSIKTPEHTAWTFVHACIPTCRT